MLGDHARNISISFSDIATQAQTFERGSTAQTAEGMNMVTAAHTMGEQVEATQKVVAAAVALAGTMVEHMAAGAQGTESAVARFMGETRYSSAAEIEIARDNVSSISDRIIGEDGTMPLVGDSRRMADELQEIQALMALVNEKISIVTGIATTIRDNAKPGLGPSITGDLTMVANHIDRYATSRGLNIPLPRSITSAR